MVRFSDLILVGGIGLGLWFLSRSNSSPLDYALPVASAQFPGMGSPYGGGAYNPPAGDTISPSIPYASGDSGSSVLPDRSSGGGSSGRSGGGLRVEYVADPGPGASTADRVARQAWVSTQIRGTSSSIYNMALPGLAAISGSILPQRGRLSIADQMRQQRRISDGLRRMGL